MQKLFSLFVLVITFSLSAMVAPPRSPKASCDPMPLDIRRYAVQFLNVIASSNVYEVAETMKALNATDRFFHNAIQSEQVFDSILLRMPYFSNKIDLIERLRKFPVIKRNSEYYAAMCDTLKQSLKPFSGTTQLTTPAQSLHATRARLEQRDINLNYIDLNYSESESLAKRKQWVRGWVESIKNPLTAAVWKGDIEEVKLLLAAGANPDVCDLNT